MNEASIPKGWQWIAIGLLGRPAGGGTPSKTVPSYWNGDIPWVSPKDMKARYISDTQDHITEAGVENSPAKKLPPKSILIVFRSGILVHSLPIAIARRELTVNQDIKAILPSVNYVPEYLVYALQARAQYLLRNCVKKGATVHSIDGEKFWAEKLPVPFPDDPARSLREQHRIVARIESMLNEVSELRSLHQQVISNVEALYRTIVFNQADWMPQYKPMRRLVNWINTDVEVKDDELYHFAGVYSFGRGVFQSKSLLGADFSYRRLTRLKAGHFTYPKLMAWEGALGSVPEECAGCVVSPEYPVFEVDESQVLPEVLDTYFRTSSIWPRLAELSTGTNARRRRLNPELFLTYEFPVPPMEVQMQLRKAKRELGNNRELNQIATALKELEPTILAQAFREEL